MYEDLSPRMFVNGYLEVLTRVDQDTKVHMLSHLQDLIIHGEAFGWPMVLAYYATLFQHLEQVWAMWGDHDTKLK